MSKWGVRKKAKLWLFYKFLCPYIQFLHDINIIQTPQNSHRCLVPLLRFLHVLRSQEHHLCQGEIPFLFYRPIFNIPGHLTLLPFTQILTKSVKSFSYVLITIILNFLPSQNILFPWGTGPILIKRPQNLQNIGNHIDQAFLLRFSRFDHVRNHKNVPDFSVIFADFYWQGDERFFD